jgi:hypothetical protein
VKREVLAHEDPQSDGAAQPEGLVVTVPQPVCMPTARLCRLSTDTVCWAVRGVHIESA